MKKNMGKVDRTIRFLVAVVVIILFATNIISGILGSVLLVFAGIFLLTSFVSFCPIYVPFGISTCSIKED